MLMRHKEEDIYSVNKTLFYVDNIWTSYRAKNIHMYRLTDRHENTEW